MNCEKCLAQLDEYLDGSLSSADCAVIKNHLESCPPCGGLSADLVAIFSGCEETRDYLESPPNPQALWLRISNIVECERSVLLAAEAKTIAATTNTAPKAAGWWNRNWQLSTQQVFSAVVGIAVITSLLTVIGVQNGLRSQINSSAAQSSLLPSLFGGSENTQPTLNNNAVSDNRVKQQEIAIDYWNRRVETRKNQWNRHLRDAFDRNLHEIDQVVADYQQQLQINPADKISEEMLDSALNDKMSLLREFSEL